MALTTTREFRSTDPGAPVLTGQAGSGIAWLRACLVGDSAGIAYGTGPDEKRAAGWTMPFHDPVRNIAVFRNSLAAGGSGCHLRVDDGGSAAGGTREMLLRLYASMSDVDTGTEPTPTAAQVLSGMVLRKSITANSVARDWILSADERTMTTSSFPGHVFSGVEVGHYSFHAGDYDCDDPAQARPCVIAGSDQPGSDATYGSGRAGVLQTMQGSDQNGIWRMRGNGGGIGPVKAAIASVLTPSSANHALGGSSMPMANPAPGSALTYFQPALLWSESGIIGRLRGVWIPQNSLADDALGKVYPSATGPTSKLVVCRHQVANGVTYQRGYFCVEAAEAW